MCLQICGGLSTAGCLLIILSGLFYKKLRSFTFRLIIYLSVADLLASICNTYTGFLFPDDESIGCMLQALIMNYSQLASILMTGTIAYSLYLMIVRENLDVGSKENKFLVFCFGVPAVLTPLPLITNSYGSSKGWCWITDDHDNSLWMLLEFYGPFFAIFIINFYFYFKIYRKIYHESHETFETKVMKKLMKRLRSYPISLVCCFGLAVAHRIYYLCGGDDNYYLDLVSGCMISLYGFINAIVYGFTRSVRKSIKRTFNHILFSNDNCSTNQSKLVE